MTAAVPTSVANPAGQRVNLIAASLFALTFAVFLPSVRHGFITYDDPKYVTENVHVNTGVSWANVRWACTSTEASNWHPLTWMSHMLDCQLFGLNAAGHHLTNVLLHAFSTLLLFLALRRLTRAEWPSLAVAALFGLHPLHVESVAWISERKDVLSTVFGMLVLWLYAVRADRLREERRGAGWLYGAAWLSFGLGLAAKSMLVTLPCVMLLLDFWPLRRWRDGTARARTGLIVEKLPFLALSAGVSAITVLAQTEGEAVGSVEDFTVPVRISTALISYCRYLGKCFLPVRLGVFYPNFAQQPPWPEVVGALAVLLAITFGAAWLARRRPYLLIGWLWFLGTLVPVIGFVQVGGQTMADRYSYFPLVGVFIMVAWTLADAPLAWARHRVAWSVAAVAALGVLTGLTVRQLRFWRSGEALFRHTAAITQDNWVAHYNLFIVLRASAPQEAREHLERTLRILADFAAWYDAKGIGLAQTPGREVEAEKSFRTAIRVMSSLPGPHYHLGMLLARAPERRAEAITELQAATRLKPDLVEAQLALASLLSEVPERANESIAAYEAVLVARPNDFAAHFNLAVLLTRVPWRRGEALDHFETARRLQPDSAPARDAVAKLRAELGL
jgi:tetratricopeptide (TPR) repeat protein